MPTSAKFWDKMAQRYAKTPIRDEKAYEKKLEITQGYFTPETQVLEFACGTGTTAIHHAPHVKHILATDISSGMLDIARGKAKDAGVENITFEQHDIAVFDAPEGTYDVILAMSILHLLEDKEATMAQVHKWLKPGGVFISSTVCLGEMSFLFPTLIGAMKLIGMAPKVVNSLKHTDLVASVLNTGFTIDHEMRMSKEKVTFIVARKAA